MRDHFFHRWEFAEYPTHEHSALWYAVAGAGAAAMFVWAAFSQNYLFGLIIVLGVFILFLHDARSPQPMRVSITQEGLELGFRDESASRRLIRWRDLQSFWMVYEPPDVKSLYIHYKRFWSPHLMIPLEGEDPAKIRRTLKKYLDEDTARQHEPVADVLRRVLRL